MIRPTTGEEASALYSALQAPPALGNLRAIVLLAGSVQRSEFFTSIQRSPLDLPISADQSILDLWRGHSLRLSRLADQDRLPVRILLSRTTAAPSAAPGDAEMGLSIEQDPCDFRGTGGVLSDIARGYNDDDFLVVATAAQILLEPLGDLVLAMRQTSGAVCLLAHDDGTPSGLMLVRCGCLRRIPEVGFIDMKEQALPLIAREHRVTVLRQAHSVILPIRTLEHYTCGLHQYHRRIGGDANVGDPLAEQWFSTAAVIERGAEVDVTARLHDSVVLRGGRVERDAVLVRTVVCPGGVVGRGESVVRRLVRTRK